MIISSIESNNLHLIQIETIQVNCVAEVPLRAIWLRRQRKVYRSMDHTYMDDISASKEAYNGSFNRARVASEDDGYPPQSSYQQSDLSALLQTYEPMQEAL